MFNNKKYTKWYFNIVNAARSRNVLENEYYEKHHIIPKSLGGNNYNTNIVLVTAREHFILHLLLPKMTSGNSKRKMCFALNALLRGNKKRVENSKITSHIYHYAKRLFADTMRNLWLQEDYRKNQIDKKKKYWNNLDNRNQASLNSRKSWNQDRKQKQSSIMKDYWTDSNKENQSRKQKEIHKNNPILCSKKSNPGKLNGMYGKHHTKETSIKLGLLAKERFTNKSYDELYGKEKSQLIKNKKSKSLKLYFADNPGKRSKENNSNAKKFLVISPVQIEYVVSGNLKTFCKENNLSLDGMIKTHKSGIPTNGKNKGWRIYEL